MLNSPMRGKWAAGIIPRNFAWVIKGKLAVAERPGGHGGNHRPVRRMEEIIWLKQEGFSRVVSLLPSPHNLHAYSEHEVASVHVPFGPHADPINVLGELYPKLKEWMGRGEKLLIHQEEVSDRVMGVIGGYLLWAGMLPNVMQAINVVEQLLARQMGSPGRELVAMAARVEGSAVEPVEAPVADLGPLPPPRRTVRRPLSLREKAKARSLTAKKAAAKKRPATTAVKTAAKKALAKKNAAKEARAKKAASRIAAKKEAAKKAAVSKKAAAKRAAARKKDASKKASAKKAGSPKKAGSTKKAAARKSAAKKALAKKSAARKAKATKKTAAKRATVGKKAPAKKAAKKSK